MDVTIQDFPMEILAMIFDELNLNDIGNCAQTCRRWEQVIATLFQDKGKMFDINCHIEWKIS